MAVRSIERSIRSRFLPQFTFRDAMLAVTGAVALAWLIRMSIRGQDWATALLVPFVAALLYFLVSIVLFLLAWLPATFVSKTSDDVREGNPFAADQLPPQILPPKSP